MDKRLVTFKVEPGLLADFDRWCQAEALTRTAALTEFMQTPRRSGRVCRHPRKMLTVLGYLTRCDPAKGGCGVKVR